MAELDTSPRLTRGVLRGDLDLRDGVRREREEAEDEMVMSIEADEGSGGGSPTLSEVELDCRDRREVCRLLGVVWGESVVI